jgi:uncharacterized protein
MSGGKILCIYHSNCADGLGAAWAVWRSLRAGRANNPPDIEFVAAKYGDAPPVKEAIGREVVIVDFSYPIEDLRALSQVTGVPSVIVLDHHESAQKDLSQLPIGPPDCRDWFDGSSKPNLAVVFDLERSGAGLTWDWFSPGEERPFVIDLIEDRDLWRFNLGWETRAFHAWLMSEKTNHLQYDLDLLDRFHFGSGIDERNILNRGDAIVKFEERLVEGIVNGTKRAMTILDKEVPVACVPGQLASEAGNLMCSQPWHGAPRPWFTATYYDGSDGLRHFSLRSPPEGANVAEIAKRFGGGGHAHAAGFVRPTGWEGELGVI